MAQRTLPRHPVKRTWVLLRGKLAEYPEAVAFISFLLIFTFFASVNEHFLTPIAISNILTFGSIVGIVVIGVAMLMISGEFDLSVGSIFAVASYVFALSLNRGIHPLLALTLALAVSAFLGLVNGLIVVGTRIPSFIATLGTMLAYRGIARAVGHGRFATYKGPRPFLFDVLNAPLESLNRLFSPPATFRLSILWFLAIAILMSFVLLRTRYGNWTYATGGDADAARAQGVPVLRVKLTNFVLSGFFAGLASVIQFAHRTSVDPLRGAGMELIAVAAAVIGGVQLTGGYGTILGATVGILIIQMMEQGLVLMQVPIQVFQAFAGLLIIVAVLSNKYLSSYG
ncbi:MAG: ABC transporter permease [Chloroflexi bacterium]|nr:ABC transporter permease [Chloroflexota bacterium]